MTIAARPFDRAMTIAAAAARVPLFVVVFVSAIAATASSTACAQGDPANELSIHALNQLEYSLSSDDERPPILPRESFEDWLDVDVRYRGALLGFRYTAFQPLDRREEGTPDLVDEGITQRYAAFEFGSSGVRGGNFYELFGKGMLFRAYEDRSIRIDTNMDGVLVWASRGPIAGKAFSGRMGPRENDLRTPVLRGADIEVRPAGPIVVGGSYLTNSTPDPRDLVPAPDPRHVEAVGGRIGFSHDVFDVYFDAGRLNDLFAVETGRGYYGSLTLFPPLDRSPLSVLPIAGLGLTGEYKNYEDFRFLNYNNPPAATREPTYTLLSRHPYVLNPDNEKGYLVEAVITPRLGSTLTITRSETDRQNGAAYFEEWFAEYKTGLGDAFEVTLVYDFIRNVENAVKDYTPIAEVQYAPGGEWSLRSEYQFQITDRGEVDETTHMGLLEYNVSPDLSFSVVGEMADIFDPVSRETDWESFGFGQVDYHITDEHFLSVTAGKRREGYICVGGICRYEPQFEGIEGKLVTTF
jgi:Family of unknown function (DUF6029)